MKTKSIFLYGLILPLAVLAVFLLCLSVGSAAVPVRETAAAVWRLIRGLGAPVDDPVGAARFSIISSRLWQVICAGLMGAALALCGAAMQGLLRNPLADGSTLGVSSGGAVGAALAILLHVTVPGWPLAGGTLMAMVFAFGSLVLILGLAYAMDRNLSTHTIILTGMIFSMLASSILSLLITFSGEKLRSIAYWTMGSLYYKNSAHALTLLAGLAVFGTALMTLGRELNAFSVGEENALHVGVSVRRTKLTVMISASALIGICVSVGGSVGFVGLIVPHMVRLLTGPDHRKLLPSCAFAGAIFLMLADLLARTLLSPRELPIGVVTSLVGAAVFLSIFFRGRKGGGR